MGKLAKKTELITRGGKPVALILPIREYQALLDRLEDAEDVAYLNKAKTKPFSFRPFADYLADRRQTRLYPSRHPAL